MIIIAKIQAIDYKVIHNVNIARIGSHNSEFSITMTIVPTSIQETSHKNKKKAYKKKYKAFPLGLGHSSFKPRLHLVISITLFLIFQYFTFNIDKYFLSLLYYYYFFCLQFVFLKYSQ